MTNENRPNENNETGSFATPPEAKRLQELKEKFEENYLEFKRKKAFEAPCMRTTLLTSIFSHKLYLKKITKRVKAFFNLFF